MSVIFWDEQFSLRIILKESDIHRLMPPCFINCMYAGFLLYYPIFLFSIGSLWFVVRNFASEIADFKGIAVIYFSKINAVLYNRYFKHFRLLKTSALKFCMNWNCNLVLTALQKSIYVSDFIV